MQTPDRIHLLFDSLPLFLHPFTVSTCITVNTKVRRKRTLPGGFRIGLNRVSLSRTEAFLLMAIPPCWAHVDSVNSSCEQDKYGNELSSPSGGWGRASLLHGLPCGNTDIFGVRVPHLLQRSSLIVRLIRSLATEMFSLFTRPKCMRVHVYIYNDRDSYYSEYAVETFIYLTPATTQSWTARLHD